ncbi:hypothetical protein [Dyadobacter frigoris]|uniref:Uncharacterized protein n=1 Tax=Dyadobacter frigoris TaxID=2576211 RepID=A0A4U6CX31_9BACT|nr:hypothetical protein [Dyadobacter frigoris]TKT89339.1 hypothetical protein FDK13_23595 [Dyadobacter frigoris]GLU55526.1 hypothetical protein Dfri01_49870 [Dyadobacter frigoris]
MKITQAQYFEIEEFFTEKCRLVETEFIEEMTDHFIDAIETKLTESTPFDAAMDSTIEDFGGLGAIQKMEWQYRKGFVKKQLQVLWALEKSQFSRQKMLRSGLIAVSLTALSFYISIFAKNSPDNFNFSNGFLIGSAALPIVTLPVFLLQRYVKWQHLFGVVKSQMVVRVYATFLLFLISILLFKIISGSEFSMLIKTFSYSILSTAFTLSFISIFEYSKTFEADYWYRTR